MKYLFDHRQELETALGGKRLLLMLDFDGTLAPIAPTPADAEMPAETRLALERLSGSPGCTVIVVSGRALSDVRDKTGVGGITYVGNHGLEMARPNEEPRLLARPQSDAVMTRMKENLTTALAPFEGVIIEDKGYSLAVHYRMVRSDDRPRVKAAVHETVEVYGGEGRMELGAGSMVLELRPPLGCDKGTIVAGLLESEARRNAVKPFAMYCGDDVTDEDAFKAIRGRGWAVLVGTPRISYAEYYLNDPIEVRRLLLIFAERCSKAGFEA